MYTFPKNVSQLRQEEIGRFCVLLKIPTQISLSALYMKAKGL